MQNKEQATYPPLMEPSVDTLTATSQEMEEDITQNLSRTDFIAYRQEGTLGVLPEAV